MFPALCERSLRDRNPPHGVRRVQLHREQQLMDHVRSHLWGTKSTPWEGERRDKGIQQLHALPKGQLEPSRDVCRQQQPPVRGL